MDFIGTKKKGKYMIIMMKNGAPDTIRTCDRLVRSPNRYRTKSVTCPDFFWPFPAILAVIINNLRRYFGRAINRQNTTEEPSNE